MGSMSSILLWGREDPLCLKKTFIEGLALGAEHMNGCMEGKGNAAAIGPVKMRPYRFLFGSGFLDQCPGVARGPGLNR
jgi:hypothetical protein